MLFALWGGSIYRPTRDLDFTGYGSNETEDVLASLREVCTVAVADDGLVFDSGSLTSLRRPRARSPARPAVRAVQGGGVRGSRPRPSQRGFSRHHSRARRGPK